MLLSNELNETKTRQTKGDFFVRKFLRSGKLSNLHMFMVQIIRGHPLVAYFVVEKKREKNSTIYLSSKNPAIYHQKNSPALENNE